MYYNIEIPLKYNPNFFCSCRKSFCIKNTNILQLQIKNQRNINATMEMLISVNAVNNIKYNYKMHK